MVTEQFIERRQPSVDFNTCIDPIVNIRVAHQRRQQLRPEKMMRFDPGEVDFRATATRFVNIFVFLKFGVSQVLRAPSIRRRK